MENRESKKVKVIHAHPGAGIFVRQSALSYLENDMLEYFLTTFVSHEKYFLSNFIAKIVPQLKRDISRKAIDELPFEKLKLYPYKELIRLFASRYASPMVTHHIWEWAELAFDKWVASVIAQEFKKQKIDAIHVYEHAALSSLQKAKQKGIFTIYEQPSVYHDKFKVLARKLFKEEKYFAEAYKKILFSPSNEKVYQRKEKEVYLSDLIICNSTFTKNSLPKEIRSRSEVIPLGFPKVNEYTKNKNENDKIIFMISGNISYLKGGHHVLRVWQKFNDIYQQAELRVIGTFMLDERERQNLPSSVTFYDRLIHEEYLQFIQQIDIAISYTYTDGFGMIISEAMAKGIPVIVTPNCMAPDFITHQKNGWIVPVGDEDALLQQMKWCVENRHLLPKIGYEAIQTAKNWQWEDFRNKTATTVKEQILIHHDKQRTK